MITLNAFGVFLICQNKNYQNFVEKLQLEQGSQSQIDLVATLHRKNAPRAEKGSTAVFLNFFSFKFWLKTNF